MTATVRVEIVVDRHRHADVPVPKGAVIVVSPATARRLLNMRLGREVPPADEAQNNNGES